MVSYVKMTENHCEGMVPLSEIPGDRYAFDAETYQIIGNKTGTTFNIGDKVR